jgi:hypothetical protein
VNGLEWRGVRYRGGTSHVAARLLLLTAVALLMTLALAWARVSLAIGGDDNDCSGAQPELVMCQGTSDVGGQFNHVNTGPPLTVAATQNGS